MLPNTGADSGVLAAIGALAVLAGTILTRLTSRRERSIGSFS